MNYEPQAINFHLGKSPPREPRGEVFFAPARDRASGLRVELRYAALRDAKNSLIRSSARRMFSVELA